MPNYMEPIFAQHEANYAAAIKGSMWGHLYPKLGSKQNGWIEWSVSAFGDTTINDYDFEGLDSSEPLMNDVMNFIIAQDHLEPGFYRWEGWYKKYKNCKCRFQSGPIHKAVFSKAA